MLHLCNTGWLFTRYSHRAPIGVWLKFRNFILLDPYAAMRRERRLVVVNTIGRWLKMKRFAASTALILFGAASATSASAADMDAMATKAPPYAVAPVATGPASCNSFAGFFLTDCQLLWATVRLYGTVDVGGTYQTHGTPFDKNFPTGASYLLGAGGTGATNRTPGFGLGPNAMSQSVIGISSKEPLGAGWSFVTVNELAYDPYSLLLANAPAALAVAKGTAQNTEALPFELEQVGLARRL